MANKKTQLLNRISSWNLLFLCVVSAFFTFLLMYQYGPLNKPILESSFKLKKHVENISKDQNAKESIKRNENLKNLIDEIPTIYDQLNKAGYELVNNMMIYRGLAILSILFAAMTFFFNPKWVGIIALPIGLIAFMCGAF
jgi:hypothetical protein